MIRRGLAIASTAVLALLAGTAAANEAPPRLVGTVLVPGTAGRAVFEDAAGRQVARRVGDPVMPGVRLAAVRRGVVDLVDAAGRRVTVRAGSAAEPPTAAPEPHRAASSGGTAAVAVSRGDEGAVHPTHIRHGSRLAHVRTGERFEGLRLVGGPPDTPLVRAGLRPGDLIVTVGGRDLDGADARLIPSLLEALDAAVAEAPLLVEARRGDEVIRVAVGGQ